MFLSLFGCLISVDTNAVHDTASHCAHDVLSVDLHEVVEDELTREDEEMIASLCLPHAWEAEVVPKDQEAPFLESAHYGNVDREQIDAATFVLSAGQVEANVYTWNMADYNPWGTERLATGVAVEHDTVMYSASTITSVTTFELDGYPVYGYIDSYAEAEEEGIVFPGSTGVHLYLDLGDGWVVDLSGFLGEEVDIEMGSPDSPRSAWPAPLGLYWAAVTSLDFSD